MPIASAPARVAMRSTCSAGMAVGPCFGFWIKAAVRSSVHMSKRLLHGAPSAPIDTCTPDATKVGTSAMPLPSFRLLLGQCDTRVPAAASSARSSSSRCTQCASTVRSPRMPHAANAMTLRAPERASTIPISATFSELCVCTKCPPSPASFATSRSRSSVHDKMKRGAKP